MSIVFLFDENPDVASAGSGGAAVGGARSVPDHAARSNSERAAPSARVGNRFSAPQIVWAMTLPRRTRASSRSAAVADDEHRRWSPEPQPARRSREARLHRRRASGPGWTALLRGGRGIFPEFLKLILADYKIQDARFHIAGPSNGGIAAFHVAALNPQYFLSVTAFPGYMWQPTAAKLQAISKMWSSCTSANTTSTDGTTN